MEIKNARYSNQENTIIDVEINHPQFGWIPYTFNPNDEDDCIKVLVKEFLDNAKIEPFLEATLTSEELENIKKQEIYQQLSVLTVTTYNGNVFDATLEARQNMADAIIASATLGSTTTTWRMADNSEVLITLDELKEAHALAIQEYARIKGIGV